MIARSQLKVKLYFQKARSRKVRLLLRNNYIYYTVSHIYIILIIIIIYIMITIKSSEKYDAAIFRLTLRGSCDMILLL